jgi:hypothetical protein
MARLELVRGDYGYDLIISILDARGDAVDLTNAVAQFKVKLPGASGLQVDAAMSIDDAANGLTSYTVQSADFDTIGRYQAEVQITWSGNKIMTASDLQIDVVADLI